MRIHWFFRSPSPIFITIFSCVAGLSAENWSGSVDNNWEVNGNWIPATFPNSPTANANFGNVILAPTTVSVGIPITVDTISFDGAVPYTIAVQSGSGGSLLVNSSITYLDANGAANHIITGALTTNSTLNLVQNTTSTPIISANIGGTGSLNKTGSGNLSLTGTLAHTGTTTIDMGRLEIGDPQLISTSGDIIWNGGSLLIGANGTLSNNLVTNITGTGDPVIEVGSGIQAAVSGQISGAGDLVVSGPGEVTLTNNANNYAGNTIIKNGATLSAPLASMISNSGSIEIEDGILVHNNSQDFVLQADRPVILSGGFGAISASGTGTTTILSDISGTGTLRKLGGGRLVLNGNNTFPALEIEGGNVTVESPSNLGSGIITVIGNATAVISVSQPITIPNDIALNDGQVFISPTAPITLSGTISGNGNADLNLLGNVTLEGNNNTYLGTTSIGLGSGGGTLILTGNNNLGTGLLLNNNSTVQFADTVSIPNDVQSGSTGIFSVPSGSATIQGTITGGGIFLEKEGAGTLSFTGDYQSTANMNINQGTLRLAVASALPSGGDIRLGAATLNTGSTSTHTGAFELVTGTGTVDVDPSTTFSLTQGTSGSQNLVKTGAGSFNPGTLAHTGTTTIDMGRIEIGDPQVVSTSGDIIWNGGSLLIGTGGILSNNLVTNITGTGDPVIEVGSGVEIAVPGQISGPGDLVVSGSGEVELTNNANNYAGNTIIKNGGVIAAPSALMISNSGSIEIEDGILSHNNATDDFVIQADRPVIVSGAFGAISVVIRGSTRVLSDISGTATFKKLGPGTLFLNGNNTFPALDIDGGNVTVESPSNLGSGTITMIENPPLPNASVALSVSQPMTIPNDIVLNEGTPIIFPMAPLTLSGTISSNGNPVLFLISNPPNTPVTFEGNNTYAGRTSIDLDFLLILTGNNNLGTSQLSNSKSTVQFADGVSIPNDVVVRETGRFSVPSGSATIQGTITGGTLAVFVKEGAGTLFLTGDYQADRNVEISEGTLDILAPDALPNVQNIVFNGGSLSTGSTGTLANEITLNVAGTGDPVLELANGAEATITGQIGGSGDLVLSGDGTFKLTNTGNNYGGNTIVQDGANLTLSDLAVMNGSLELADGILGIETNDITLDSNQSVTLNGAFGRFSVPAGRTLTIEGDVSGTGALTTLDEGTLVLTGNNTFTGIEHGAGVLSVAGASNLGPGTITFSDVAQMPSATRTIEVTQPGAIPNNIALNESGTFSSNQAVTLSGSISSNGDQELILSTTGGGEFTLDGNNTYSGTTRLEGGGSLILTGNNDLGTSSLANNGSTVQLADTLSIPNDIVIEGSTQFSVPSGSATLEGTITGNTLPSSFLKAGPGVLSITGDNQSSADMNIIDGTLRLASANALPNGGGITFNGSATLNTGATFTHTGAFQLFAGPDIFSPGPATVEVDTNTTFSLTQGVVGNQDLIKAGDGTFNAGSLAHNGTTRIDAGRIEIGDPQLTSSSLDITCNGGSLSIGSTGTLSNNLILNIAGTGNPVVEVANSAQVTVAGQVSGSGDLVLSGNGLVRLTNTGNNYSGNTLVQGGVNLTLSDISVINGSLELDEGILATETNDITLASNQVVTLSGAFGGLSVPSGRALTIEGNISGTGALRTLDEGTVTLTGNNTFTGVEHGAGTLSVPGASNLGTGTITFVSTAQMPSATRTIEVTQPGTIPNTIVLSDSGIFSSDQAVTLSGVMSSSGDQVLVFSTVGGGAFTLQGNNTYSGTTRLEGGGSLILTGNSNVGTSVLSNNGSTVQLANTLAIANDIVIAGSTQFSVPSGLATLQGTITGNTLAPVFLKNGAGTLSIAGDYQSIADMNINDGTLRLSSANALPNGGGIAFNGSATLNTGATFTHTGAFQLFTGPVSPGPATVEVDTNTTFSLTQGVVGNQDLIKTGDGTFNAGSLAHTGTTRIDAGHIEIGDPQLSSSSGDITANGGFLLVGSTGTLSNNLILNIAGTGNPVVEVANSAQVTVAGQISGSGDLVLSGDGIARLTNTGNNYSGNTVVQGGTNLTLSDISVINGSLELGDGILVAETNDITLPVNQVVTFNGAFGGLSVPSGRALTIEGDISGTGTLRTLDEGTVTLTGNNTFIGVEHGAGTLSVPGASNLGTGTITFVSTAQIPSATRTIEVTQPGTIPNTIVLNDSGIFSSDEDVTLSGSIFSGGAQSLTFSGVGNYLISGNNTHAGMTTTQQATLIAGSDTAFGSTTLVLDGGNLATSGNRSLSNPIMLNATGGNIQVGNGSTLNLSGAISGANRLELIGDGTNSVVLAGVNSYLGGTLIDQITCQISSNDNLGSGDVSIASGTLRIANTLSAPRNFTFSSTASAPSIEVDQGQTLTIEGDILGSRFIKEGPGQILFSSPVNSAFTETVAVQSGTFTVGEVGSIANATIEVFSGGVVNGAGGYGDTIVSGGKVSGNGFYKSVSLQSGLIAPGDSIGIINITGNYVQMAGAIYEVEIDRTLSDQILVGGTATIENGAILNILPPIGTIVEGTFYDILIANGGIDLLWSEVNSLGNVPFSVSLVDGGTTARLTILSTCILDQRNIDPGNPLRVDEYFNQLKIPVGSDLLFVALELDTLDDQALNAALDTLHPGLFGAFPFVNLDVNGMTSYLLGERLRSCAEGDTFSDCSEEQTRSIWVSPYGLFSNVKKIEELRGFETTTGGFLLGYDTCSSHQDKVGAFTGYQYTDLDWDQNAGKASMQKFCGGVYGGFGKPAIFLDLEAFGGADFYSTKRRIDFASIDRTATAKYTGGFFTGSLGLNTQIDSIAFEGFANSNYNYLYAPSFQEEGASSLNLAVMQEETHFLRTEIGGRFVPKITFESGCMECFLGSSWVYKTNLEKGRKSSKYAEFADQAAMLTITTFDRSLGFVTGSVGVRGKVGPFAFETAYKGEFRSDYLLNTFNISFGGRF
ncbi:MAG: autotransporter domain-containing protein [Chlamydiota bacterium]